LTVNASKAPAARV